MTETKFSRRAFLVSAASAGTVLFESSVLGKEVMKDITDLKPGEFTWHPERAPEGPVAIVVSLPEQRVHVYRNGIRMAVSTCSTGKKGHETPVGVFVVLQKDRNHRSSTYNNAAMPNMNRLTWDGVALHAGKLPGYPASHGCVRLPMKFSELLFTVTHLGTPVIIAGSHTDPWELTHPGMVLGDYAESEFEHVLASLQGKKHPADWSEADAHPIHSVIASSASKEIELIENDVVIARSGLRLTGGPNLGSHVFMLIGHDHDTRGMRWSAVSHHHEDGAGPGGSDILTRMKADEGFVAAMRNRLHPGMMLITTDAPLHPDARSKKDFVIMSTS